MAKKGEERDGLTGGVIDGAVKDLRKLIGINSVEAAPEDDAPFGAEVKRALDFTLAKAAAFGFETRNIDGYAGYAELKSFDPKAETLGILTHLDIVPAGEHWTVKQGKVRDGKIYGRGALDNKGPTVACLYALKLIKDSELAYDLRRNIRLIWGCNEESGMACMKYYADKIGMPEIGFSPDSDFPLIICEKTILQLKMTFSADGLKDLISWRAGTAPNSVPSLSVMRLSKRLANRAQFCVEEHPGWGQVKLDGDGTAVVTSYGKSAHSMSPFLGDNAMWKSAWILAEVLGADCPVTLKQFVQNFCTEKALERLKLECFDERSGAQTLNMGTLNYDRGKVTVSLDFRCPIKQDLDLLRVKTLSAIDGAAIETKHYAPYKYSAPDSELVKSLSEVYTRVTGKPAKPIITGGGTYARTMDNCIAFGPAFEEKNNIHDADEFIVVDHLERLIKIYYHAMLKLAGKAE